MDCLKCGSKTEIKEAIVADVMVPVCSALCRDLLRAEYKDVRELKNKIEEEMNVDLMERLERNFS